LALATNNNPRTSGVNGDFSTVLSTLQVDASNTSLHKTLLDVIPNLKVFGQQMVEIPAISKPPAFPGSDNTEPETDWINFLSHSLDFFLRFR
jgi:hypothetical protein